MTYLPVVAYPPSRGCWFGPAEGKGSRDAEPAGGTKRWPWRRWGDRARDGWAQTPISTRPVKGHRAPIIVGLALVGGAIVWTGWVAYHLPTTERSDDVAPLVFFGIWVGGIVGAISLWVSRRRRRPPARSVDTLAALLAEAVRGQWRQAAIERRLVTPAPISVR